MVRTWYGLGTEKVQCWYGLGTGKVKLFTASPFQSHVRCCHRTYSFLSLFRLRYLALLFAGFNL